MEMRRKFRTEWIQIFP